MKILIVYASKTGTSKTCAYLLADNLKNFEVTVSEVSNNGISLSDYDICIIGGSIRMGKLDTRISGFLSKNKYELREKAKAFFICNGFSDEVEKYFHKCFPREFIESAIICDSFGGELKAERQRGIDKLILKIMLKTLEEDEDFALPSIQTESIGRFADKIKLYSKNISK